MTFRGMSGAGDAPGTFGQTAWHVCASPCVPKNLRSAAILVFKAHAARWCAAMAYSQRRWNDTPNDGRPRNAAPATAGASSDADGRLPSFDTSLLADDRTCRGNSPPKPRPQPTPEVQQPLPQPAPETQQPQASSDAARTQGDTGAATTAALALTQGGTIAALALTQGGMPAVLSSTELLAFSNQQRVSTKRAHKEFAKLRAEMSQDGDVTEWVRNVSQEGWVRNYLLGRPDASALVDERSNGRGWVVDIVVAFLEKSRDTNLHMPRFDIVLRYWGDLAARIHPSSNSDGVEVFGKLWEWAVPKEGLLAYTQEVSRPAPLRTPQIAQTASGFRSLHQTDRISRRGLCAYLTAVAEEWQGIEHSRPPFAMDLTNQEELLPWSHALASQESHKFLLEAQVQNFWRVWLKEEERPAFWVRSMAQGDWVLDPLASGSQALYRCWPEHRENISWA